MVPKCKPEWNREAIMVLSRLPSLMAADKPCPQLQSSLLKSTYLKITSSSLSRLVAHFKDFQMVYEEEIWCLCTVTFGQKNSKFNSRPVYCSQLYGRYSKVKIFFSISIGSSNWMYCLSRGQEIQRWVHKRKGWGGLRRISCCLLTMHGRPWFKGLNWPNHSAFRHCKYIY
jgi:hypothetical protein